MEQIGLERLTGLIAFARTASLGSYSAACSAGEWFEEVEQVTEEPGSTPKGG